MKVAFGSKTKGGRRAGATLVGAGLAVFVAALYVSTLAPTVLRYSDETKDAAAIPTAAYVLGIMHPTGYPTYTILTHLFTYLPVGDVAYRVNLSSAVFGVLAVAVAYVVGLILSRRVVAAAVGAVSFGASGLFWSQAVIAEVYTLHVLFVALALFALLQWRERRRDGYLLLAAFLMGLSMTHHLTSGLLLPGAVLFVLLVDWRKLLQWRLVSCGAGLFLVGLLPYAYLPLRARMDPPLNTGDPSDWERFWNLVSGAGWQSSMFAFGPRELPERFAMYFDHLSGQFHWAFLLAGIAGGIYLLARDRAAFALLGFLFAGFLFYALEYDIEDVQYYFIPTYLVLVLFATAGLGALLRKTEALTRGDPEIRRAALVGLAGLALPLWGVGDTYRAVDRSADYEGRETIELVAREVEEDGLVIQHRSPLGYMQMVEGRREDIGLRRFSHSLEEKVAWAYARDRPIYALVPEDFPTAAGMLRQLEDAGYRLIPIKEDRLYEIVPDRSGVPQRSGLRT